MKYYIGLDNGVTGAIGIVNANGTYYWTGNKPTYKQQDYTKAKKNITRISIRDYMELFKPFHKLELIAIIERPMVNPTRFYASVSALRCLEAELCCLEALMIPRIFIDSRIWQKEFFPPVKRGMKRQPAELKQLSIQKGNELFPSLIMSKVPDFDGLLIAEWARRNNK